MHNTPKRVREPVQVYMEPDDKALLDQLAAETSLSRADLRLSLSDAVTCELMRQDRLDTVFAFDRDFVTVGYRLQREELVANS